MIRGAEAVGGPRAQRWPAGENRTGVHLADRTNVIDAVRPAGPDDGHVVHMRAGVFVPVRDPHAALPPLFPDTAGRHQIVVLRTLSREFWSADGIRDRLAIKAHQVGFVIKQVDVAGAAFHEKKDDGFGGGRVMRSLGSQRIGGFAGGRARLFVKQGGERNAGKTAAGFGEKLTPAGDVPVMFQLVQHDG